MVYTYCDPPPPAATPEHCHHATSPASSQRSYPHSLVTEPPNPPAFNQPRSTQVLRRSTKPTEPPSPPAFNQPRIRSPKPRRRNLIADCWGPGVWDSAHYGTTRPLPCRPIAPTSQAPRLHTWHTHTSARPRANAGLPAAASQHERPRSCCHRSQFVRRVIGQAPRHT